MTYRFLPEAETELEDAADWYARKSVRTVYRFYATVNRLLQLITSQPRAFSPVARPPARRDIRQVRIGRYSYKLVYEVLPSEVVVLSVTHVRRRSQPWRRRTP